MFEHWTRKARRIPLQSAVLASACLLLAACAGSGGVYEPPAAPDSGPGAQAAQIALQQLGVPYRYGGSTPQGFDCSGLVQYAYANAGVTVPRTTGGLWDGLAPVGNKDLRSGDVLFFAIDGKMSHVGMYIGNGQFVHAPASGRNVEIESLESAFYSQAYIRAGRAKPARR